LWFFVHISKNVYVHPAVANFRCLRHASRCEVAGSESMALTYGYDSTWPSLSKEALEEAASPRSPHRPRGAQQPHAFQVQTPAGNAATHDPLNPKGAPVWRTSFGTRLDSTSPSPARSISPGRSPRRSARSGSPTTTSRSGSPLASSRGRTPRHPRPRSPGRKTPRSPMDTPAPAQASEYGTSAWPPSDSRSMHKPVLFNPPSRTVTPRFADHSVYDAAKRSLSGSPMRERPSTVFDSSPPTARTAHEMGVTDEPRPHTLGRENVKSRQLFEIQHLLAERSSADLEAITRLLKR
jgi:hypothetical protein